MTVSSKSSAAHAKSPVLSARATSLLAHGVVPDGGGGADAATAGEARARLMRGGDGGAAPGTPGVPHATLEVACGKTTAGMGGHVAARHAACDAP